MPIQPLFHYPYEQTEGKVLESELIDNLFMLKVTTECAGMLRRYSTGVYCVMLAPQLELWVCFEDEFQPSLDGYMMDAYRYSEKHWLYFVYGEFMVHRFIYGHPDEPDVWVFEDSNGGTGKLGFYCDLQELMRTNESCMTDKEKVTAVSFNPEMDAMLLRYILGEQPVHTRHALKELLSYDEVIVVKEIQAFKKRLRKLINDAGAVTRLKNRLNNQQNDGANPV